MKVLCQILRACGALQYLLLLVACAVGQSGIGPAVESMHSPDGVIRGISLLHGMSASGRQATIERLLDQWADQPDDGLLGRALVLMACFPRDSSRMFERVIVDADGEGQRSVRRQAGLVSQYLVTICNELEAQQRMQAQDWLMGLAMEPGVSDALVFSCMEAWMVYELRRVFDPSVADIEPVAQWLWRSCNEAVAPMAAGACSIVASHRRWESVARRALERARAERERLEAVLMASPYHGLAWEYPPTPECAQMVMVARVYPDENDAWLGHVVALGAERGAVRDAARVRLFERRMLPVEVNAIELAAMYVPISDTQMLDAFLQFLRGCSKEDMRRCRARLLEATSEWPIRHLESLRDLLM